MNTNRHGKPWTDQQIKAVWDRAKMIPDKPSNEVRIDTCGAVIWKSHYGRRDSTFGWEIDHIDPVSNGGGDELYNLQALQWRHNVNKSDSLDWVCPR